MILAVLSLHASGRTTDRNSEIQQTMDCNTTESGSVPDFRRHDGLCDGFACHTHLQSSKVANCLTPAFFRVCLVVIQ